MHVQSKTVRFDAPAPAVFAYLAAIESLPQWATAFCLGLRRDGPDHKVMTPGGEIFFRIDADPRTGVIDFWGGPDKGRMRRWPARVVDDQQGSAVFVFTAIQMPDEADALFEAQCASLEHEFEAIRRAVEPAPAG